MRQREQARLLRGPRASSAQATDQQIKSAYRKLALKYPPRSQSRRPQGRGAVQGSGRGLRGPRRRGEARPLRPLRPRRASSGAGGGAGFDPTIFADFSDIFSGLGDVVRLRRHLRRPAAARRAAARRRSALRPRDHLRGVGDRHRDDDPDSARGDLRDLQGLRRRRRHAAPRPARSAAAPASCATSRASSPSRGRARTAAAPARRSPSRARPAAAPDASAASAS